MTTKRDEVLDMVRRQLHRANPPSTEALYGRAARIDNSLRELSLRQFNARYPLQVRREMARAEKTNRQPTESSDTNDFNRDGIRQVLLDFARTVSDATDAQLIDLLTDGVEDYIDRILHLANR